MLAMAVIGKRSLVCGFDIALTTSRDDHPHVAVASVPLDIISVQSVGKD